MGDDERIAYLGGEPGVALTAQEQLQLDELRALLAHPAVWAEPDPELQERVVRAIADAGEDTARSPRSRAQRRWVRYPVIGVAAAALIGLGVAIGLRDRPTPVETYAATLTGTRLAPTASGQATLTESAGGWKIELKVNSLPRRDNGLYYEAWLKNPAGTLVPIGTFNEPTDVILWAGVPPDEFATLTITQQVADGQQASSGRVVLSGPAHRTG